MDGLLEAKATPGPASAATGAQDRARRPVHALLARIVVCVLGSAVVLAVCASPALAGAWWRLSSRAAPSSLPPGGNAAIVVSATDVGDDGIDATTEPVTIKDTLPAGLEAIKIGGKPALRGSVAHEMTCDLATVT
jgi:hypothetical protein